MLFASCGPIAFCLFSRMFFSFSWMTSYWFRDSFLAVARLRKQNCLWCDFLQDGGQIAEGVLCTESWKSPLKAHRSSFVFLQRRKSVPIAANHPYTHIQIAVFMRRFISRSWNISMSNARWYLIRITTYTIITSASLKRRCLDADNHGNFIRIKIRHCWCLQGYLKRLKTWQSYSRF